MKRILCLWFPNWPRQRRAAEASAARSRQRPQLPRLPDTEVYTSADREALVKLAESCEQFSPLVGLEDSEQPESLLLEIDGVAPLFGGEQALAERIVRHWRERGLDVQLAIAHTPSAAWARARWGVGSNASLASLPIAALRISRDSEKLLAELGIERLEQLAAIPRAALASRFGAELLTRWDQLWGLVPDPITPHRPPPEHVIDVTFETPLADGDAFEHVLLRELERLVNPLAAQRQGVERLHCRLRAEAHPPLDVILEVFQATAQARHLFELLKLRLERISWNEPVSGLRLAAPRIAMLAARQQELFVADSRQDDDWQLASLVDRLSSRLGSEAVVRARLRPEAQPELSWIARPWIDATGRRSPSTSRAAADARWQRPLRLAAHPLPIDVMSVVPGDKAQLVRSADGQEWHVATAWGPERIETGWWRGKSARRDYYRVETTSGAWLWLFRRRDDGRWFLHGWFD